MTAESVKVLQAPSVVNALDMLNQRERIFVLQSTIGRLSRTAAANVAGFSNPPKNKKVNIAITAIETEIGKELEIDFAHVVGGMQDAIEMARMQGDPNTMINGYREQGRLAGLYVDKKQVEITHNRAFREEDLLEMSTEELEELIDKADAIELEPDSEGVYTVNDG